MKTDKKNMFFNFDFDVESLISQLKRYDDFYYNEGKSPVDDQHYDSLKEKAKSMDPENPYFKKVGAKVPSRKVKLDYILGSLNKVKIDTVESWMEKTGSDEFFAMEKLDGASIEVDYLDGKVVKAMTRGDGFVGQDITEKAKIFCPEVNSIRPYHFRAEAMLIGDTHKKLGFKTRRNGVVGILNRDDLKNAGRITPFFYEILNWDSVDQLGMSSEIKRFFNGTNARVPQDCFYSNYDNDNIGSLVDVLEIWKENKEYDIDGIVICPTVYERENIEYPENKVAFKMNEKPVETKVQKVEWRVGRTGRVIPLVWVEPVTIQGVEIQKATGFNYKFIVDNELGKGSVVSIVRSGDVIPYITKSIGKGMGPLIPHNCPSCEKGLSPVGVDLVCQNPVCPAKSLKQIEHFLIRMGAENITRKTLKKLAVRSIDDMYELNEFEIAQIPGLGLKRGEQIIREVEKTLNTTPEKFISALGIPLVGRSVSKLIVDYLRPKCKNDDHIMEEAWTLLPEELMKINGIGESIANMYFKNIRVYGESLLSFLYNKGLKWESQGMSVQGLVFTLTGKGPMSRNAVQTLITSNGGVVKGISKKTNYLVTSNPDSTSTKTKKARQYGIEIISYEQLIEMVE